MNAIIIEDEKNSAEALEAAVQNFIHGVEIIGKETTVALGIKLINKLNPDIIFLDVELPDGTGFDILEKIDNKNINVIFITAFEHFALKAYRFAAIDYLLKPLDIEDLTVAINKAKETKENKSLRLDFLKEKLNDETGDKKILVDSRQKYIKVSLQKIIALKAESSFAYLFLEDGTKVFSSRPLKYYENFLDSNQFVRIHRSHIINIDKIISIDKGRSGKVKMVDGSFFEFAARRKSLLMSLIKP